MTSHQMLTPRNPHQRRLFRSLLTCTIFLATCMLSLFFMINLVSDHGHISAAKMDRMVKLQREEPVIIQAKGIRNTGNICFASSMAQMLYRIDGVRKSVLNAHDNENHPIPGLKALFKALGDPDISIVRRHSAQFIPKQFISGEQGDSEEVFITWLSLLEPIVGKWTLRKELYLTVQLNRTTTNSSIISTDYWSSIKITFPEIKIAQNLPLRLQDLLSHSYGPLGEEVLSPKLKQIYRIASLPKYLAISFVRTVYRPKKGLVKINSPVLIPEILDLSPFTVSNVSTTQFRLKMFVLHQGPAAEDGHYLAYVQDTKDTWQIIDDDKVRDISKDEALNSVKVSSICFFERI